MSEQEPGIRLRFGEAEFEATPQNTTYFSFLGKTAIRGIEFEQARANHIFFQTGDEDDTTVSGSYMFRTDNNSDVYDTILNYMVEHRYPMIINRREIPQCDIDAYFRMIDQQAAAEEIPDTLPEGWE